MDGGGEKNLMIVVIVYIMVMQVAGGFVIHMMKIMNELDMKIILELNRV